ncbi:MAG TPA: indolepyruvate oxidoreductase subunit beta [Firmicutes bacterium]|nr:indolepyruvate oxidoreductase subunit beta [Bacillota bacterium]
MLAGFPGDRPLNVLIVGVGGQGIILAGKVMAGAARSAGLDVKASEVHGMAQRGGSVVTHVRFGKKVYSPLIPEGEVDCLIAFERLEALRWAHSLRPGGILIVNDYAIPPITTLSGKEAYPGGILEQLATVCRNMISVKALDLARAAGSARAVNIVLLGVASRFLGIEESCWVDALKESVPPRFVDANLRAFMSGARLP